MKHLLALLTVALAFFCSPASAAPAASYPLDFSYVAAPAAGAGQLASVTYPSGKQLAFVYDATGQLVSLSWDGQPLLTQLAWSPLGLPTSWRWPFVAAEPPLQEARTYDTAGQLVQSAVASFSWDAAGRLAAVTELLAPAPDAAPVPVQSTASYDAAGRVTAFVRQAAAIPFALPLEAHYSFEANGNRTSAAYSFADGSVRSRFFTIDPTSNKTLSVQEQQHTRQLLWDESGRLTDDGVRQFAYDAHGRLASIDTPSGRSTYLHNALGQRVRQTHRYADGSTLTTDTAYGNEAIAEGLQSWPLGHYRPRHEGAPLPLAEFIYLPTSSGPMPVAADIGGQLYAVHTDHLLTPRRLTSPNGQIVWQWPMSAFGETEPIQQQNLGLEHFTLRYPGQQADTNTGLFYNHHRFYDPKLTAAYTQADPIGLQGGANRFAYANNNPLLFTDPEGLQAVVPFPHPAVIIPLACILTPGCRDFCADTYDNLRNWMESRGRGNSERGATGGSSGQHTDNPYKKCRLGGKSKKGTQQIICHHHQTGKKIEKDKPKDWPEQKNRKKKKNG